MGSQVAPSGGRIFRRVHREEEGNLARNSMPIGDRRCPADRCRRRKVSNNEAEDEDEDEGADEDERTRTSPKGETPVMSCTMADVRRTGALVQMQKRAEHVKSISSK